MRTAACVLAMLCLALGSAGCSLFDKKPSADGRTSSLDTQRRTNGRPADNTDPLLGINTLRPSQSNQSSQNSDPFYDANAARPAPSAKTNAYSRLAPERVGGVLAGQVVDAFGQPVARGSVRCVNLDDRDDPNSPDAEVLSGGYFRVEGLRPGAHYELIARSDDGGKLAAGKSVASTPNVILRIRVDPNLVSADTPPLPHAPIYQGRITPPPAQPRPSSPELAAGNAPTLQPVRVPQAPVEFERVSSIPELAVAVKVQVAEPDAVTAGPVAPVGPPANRGWEPPSPTGTYPPPLEIVAPNALSPTLQLRTPIPVPPALSQPPPPPGWSAPAPPPNGEAPPPVFPDVNGSQRFDTPASNVPFCDLRNLQLVNFALNEINGTPWEFRQHQGKVVLLDFWATFCGPCRETIPSLVALQSRYGAQGLEIVGIACERDGTVQEQAHRVNAMCQRFQANYRQLLSQGSDCPVRSQFRIQGVPTLILIDSQGNILWRHAGQPDNAALDQLEQILQHELRR